MTALAAVRLGVPVQILTPHASGPAAPFAHTVVADWSDPNVLARFAADCDAVTAESEWVPADEMARQLPANVDLWPHPDTLRLIRHKGRQKKVLEEAGLPLPRFACCATLDEAQEAARQFGFPIVAKKFEGSYDGYGNATCHDTSDLERAWNDLAAVPSPEKAGGLLVEAWVPFEKELAVQVARRPGGEHVVYPVVYTEQRDHRCHAVVVPTGLSSSAAREAEQTALRAIEAVNGVGLLAVELFLLEDGRVLVNELAPRPHNTGHYTIEACHTSQFENHVRAVLDWPLGDPGLRVPAAAMVNLLGHGSGEAAPEGMEDALAVPGATLHVYGKNESRPGRKMGHVTVTAAEASEARALAEKAASLVKL